MYTNEHDERITVRSGDVVPTTVLPELHRLLGMAANLGAYVLLTADPAADDVTGQAVLRVHVLSQREVVVTNREKLSGHDTLQFWLSHQVEIMAEWMLELSEEGHDAFTVEICIWDDMVQALINARATDIGETSLWIFMFGVTFDVLESSEHALNRAALH